MLAAVAGGLLPGAFLVITFFFAVTNSNRYVYAAFNFSIDSHSLQLRVRECSKGKQINHNNFQKSLTFPPSGYAAYNIPLENACFSLLPHSSELLSPSLCKHRHCGYGYFRGFPPGPYTRLPLNGH